MSQSNSVPNFRPSTNGLHFTNSLQGPDFTVQTPFGAINIGDASRGVCGGMAFTVRDYYESHLLPPADTTPPVDGSELYGFVTARLLDSFNLPGGIATYMTWMATPDHDTHPIFTRRGIAWMTIVGQWPQVKATIDRGHPCPIGLVTVESVNPGDLGRNHVVTAYRYEQDGDTLTIGVYDPNSPDDDDITLRLNTANPEHTTPIASTVRIGDPVRGFFVLGYSAKTPPVSAGPVPTPQPPVPPRTLKIDVQPNQIHWNTSQMITVTATDSVNGVPVFGDVLISGSVVGHTGVAFPYTFHRVFRPRRIPIGKPLPDGPDFPPLAVAYGTVRADGYASPTFTFPLPDTGIVDPDLLEA